jgi:hypothetical protein
MRTPSNDSPRRRTARSALGLALVLALAHGTTGCAHQLTNAEFAAGAVGVALVAAGIAIGGPWSLRCSELTMPCETPEQHVPSPVPPALGVGGQPVTRR